MPCGSVKEIELMKRYFKKKGADSEKEEAGITRKQTINPESNPVPSRSGSPSEKSGSVNVNKIFDSPSEKKYMEIKQIELDVAKKIYGKKKEAG